ncbi:MAG: S-layer homology domain-containing protein [Peptoniphilaceae bacterium]
MQSSNSQEEINKALAELQEALVKFNNSKNDVVDVKVYKVPVYLVKENEEKPSMAGDAIISPATVKISNGEVKVELNTKEIQLGNIKGKLINLKILDTQEISKREGQVFSFSAPLDIVKKTTYLKVEMATDAMPIPQKARLKFVPNSNDPSESINKNKLREELDIAQRIEKGNKTDLAFNDLKNQIELAKSVYKNSKSQEEVNTAIDNLKKAIRDFRLSKDEDINSKYNGKEFRISVVLLKEREDSLSMASKAIVSPSLVRVENGKAIAEIETQSINFSGITGRLVSLRVLSGARYIGQNGSRFIFELPIEVIERPIDVLVEMTTDAMPIPQKARLRFNGSGHYENTKISDKALLLNAIKDAEKLLEENFTKESWNKLTNSLNEAKKVYNDRNASDENINKAIKNLNESINKLVKKNADDKKDGVEKVFQVPVNLNKIGGGKSMAASALVSPAKVEKQKDGNYKYYVEFKAIDKEFGGQKLNGHLTKLFYYDETKKEAKNEGGGIWSFVLPSKAEEIKIAIWVDVMDQIMGGKAGSGEQEAILKFDWNNAKEISKGENNSELTYIDINGHWAKEAIEYVSKKGYFKGVGNNKFDPERAITRGEFVTVLGRMQKVDKNKYKNNKFKDVENNKFYTEYINWASELGIVSGMGSNEFKPNDVLTREQMAVITLNYINKFKSYSKVKIESIKFKDEKNISSWAKNSVDEMARLGIISGMGDGNFSPKTEFTRAQVAQILFNMEK